MSNQHENLVLLRSLLPTLVDLLDGLADLHEYVARHYEDVASTVPELEGAAHALTSALRELGTSAAHEHEVERVETVLSTMVNVFVVEGMQDVSTKLLALRAVARGIHTVVWENHAAVRPAVSAAV